MLIMVSLTFEHSVLPNDEFQLLGPGVDEARPVGFKEDVAAVPSLEPVGLGPEGLALKVMVTSISILHKLLITTVAVVMRLE